MIELIVRDDAVLLPVKVVPGASRTRIVGPLDGRLKIAVAAPPEKGRANKALLTFLAKQLGLRRGDLTVDSGASSPTKTIRIEGVIAEQVAAALELNAG